MSVMMLRFDERQRTRLSQIARELGRQIFRVRVGDEGTGRVMEKLGKQREVLAVIVESFDVLQIALMLGKNGLAVLQETEGRLELPAHGEKFRRRLETGRQ